MNLSLHRVFALPRATIGSANRIARRFNYQSNNKLGGQWKNQLIFRAQLALEDRQSFGRAQHCGQPHPLLHGASGRVMIARVFGNVSRLTARLYLGKKALEVGLACLSL
jgi:hypothetical protein